jgi:CspA family cold shock protein
MSEIYQVKWFSKKKGYGFVEGKDQTEYFVHHTDIQVDTGFRYLKQGELVVGSPEKMEDDKVKLAKISSPMECGRLMCEVEKMNSRDQRESRDDDRDE